MSEAIADTSHGPALCSTK